jgi:glycosyltransferase involved in cell wall biosynthesis
LIKEFGVPRHKIRVSSIGLNEEMPDTELNTVQSRNKFGVSDEQYVILFFGKIDEYKGLDILLDAFEEIKIDSCRLIVAGVFRSKAYRNKILQRLAISKKRGKIRFEERHVPNEEAEIYFKAADVLCLPYRNIYQSGLAFLGPRFGLPLVTTDVGELRELVETNKLGLVAKSNDAKGLRQALEDFFSRQKDFSRDEIMRQVRKFRWDRVCSDLKALYLER